MFNTDVFMARMILMIHGEDVLWRYLAVIPSGDDDGINDNHEYDKHRSDDEYNDEWYSEKI